MNKAEYRLYIDDIIRRVERARVSYDERHIVKIVAISKYSNTDDIKALYEIGQRAFGENRVQDLKLKSNELEDLPLEWHFVGSLQKNKINNLLDLSPFLMHSLDSIELAYELQKKLSLRGETLDALLQINSAYENTKHGFLPEATKEVYEQIKSECPNINLKGVMSIGANSDDKKLIQKSFETTHKIYKELNGATICSMGMSGDFELAIECGSNMLRLGSIMFQKA